MVFIFSTVKNSKSTISGTEWATANYSCDHLFHHYHLYFVVCNSLCFKKKKQVVRKCFSWTALISFVHPTFSLDNDNFPLYTVWTPSSCTPRRRTFERVKVGFCYECRNFLCVQTKYKGTICWTQNDILYYFHIIIIIIFIIIVIIIMNIIEIFNIMIL